MRGEAETAFLEFRTHGRPRAMARVFDLTAQELLLVAANLARNGEEAAELVQQTFLAAMQQRERWDEERPLLPWLLGILLRLFRAERRQRGNERSRGEIDPDVLVSAESDPAQHAEDAELAGAFSAAIAALPETYRDVTTLRLVHGLEPVEIAHALGRPLETVRTQLRRAKEALREALPRSLAALLALELERLGDMRDSVLGEAGRLGAGSSLASAGVGWTMGTKAVASIAVLVVGGALLWSRSGGRQAPARGPDPIASQRPGEVAAHGALVSSSAGSSPESRVPAEPRAHSHADELARLACRVVWDSDGTPAAGVTVLLWHTGLGRVPVNPLAVSDERGELTFDAIPPGRGIVASDRGGRIELELARGANEVELHIPLGLLVEGVVLDEREQPVPLAELWISDEDMLSGDGLWAARAHADGTFTLRDVQPYRALAARTTRRAPGEAAWLRDGEPGARVSLTLHVGEAGPRLLGLVRSEDGAPVADAYVFVGPTAGMRRFSSKDGAWFLMAPAQSTNTDAQGRFTLEAVPKVEGWPLWIAADGFVTAFQELAAKSPETRVEITLARGTPVTGSVRDEEGNTLPHVEVSLEQPDDPTGTWKSRAPSWGFPRAFTGTAGTFDLGLASTGTAVLVAKLYQVGETRETVTLVAGEPFVWNAKLPRAADIAGVVVDEHQALAGLQVSARAEEGGLNREYLGQVVTDSDGAFRLHGAVRASYTVIVRDPRSDVQDLLEVQGVTPGREDLELVWPASNHPSARLVAHLLDADGAPYVPEWIHVERSGGFASGGSGSQCTDGRLETGLLPPGSYLVTFSREGSGRWTVGPFDLAAGEVRDVGEFVCPRAGWLEVELVDFAGAALSAARLQARPAASHAGAVLIEIRDGRGLSDALVPGDYTLTTWGGDLPMASMHVEVRAGETARARFVLPPALERWIRDPRFPAGRMDVHMEWRRDGVVLSSGPWGLGGLGKVHAMRFGPGHYEAEITLPDGRRSTTTFEVNASTTSEDQAVQLRMPE